VLADTVVKHEGLKALGQPSESYGLILAVGQKAVTAAGAHDHGASGRWGHALDFGVQIDGQIGMGILGKDMQRFNLHCFFLRRAVFIFPKTSE
jgi:hypothetical protein